MNDRDEKVLWDFPRSLPEAAWVLLAGVYDGDWSKASPEWRAAAEQWRDAYHATLPVGEPAP